MYWKGHNKIQHVSINRRRHQRIWQKSAIGGRCYDGLGTKCFRAFLEKWLMGVCHRLMDSLWKQALPEENGKPVVASGMEGKRPV